MSGFDIQRFFGNAPGAFGGQPVEDLRFGRQGGFVTQQYPGSSYLGFPQSAGDSFMYGGALGNPSMFPPVGGSIGNTMFEIGQKMDAAGQQLQLGLRDGAIATERQRRKQLAQQEAASNETTTTSTESSADSAAQTTSTSEPKKSDSSELEKVKAIDVDKIAGDSKKDDYFKNFDLASFKDDVAVKDLFTMKFVASYLSDKDPTEYDLKKLIDKAKGLGLGDLEPTIRYFYASADKNNRTDQASKIISELSDSGKTLDTVLQKK